MSELSNAPTVSRRPGASRADAPAAETPGAPRLLTTLRASLRVRHYSPRTEEAYVAWVRRFVRFHHFRHPRELGPCAVAAFLSDLATRGRVSESTQNQALAALLFLYREVLREPPPALDGVVRAEAAAGRTGVGLAVGLPRDHTRPRP
jgi:Phage integrase, N-terminal SAM-like domain